MKVSEPMAAYNTPYLQGLKNKIISHLDYETNAGKLEQCLELLYEDSMPCRFTEEELDEEIRRSEAGGYMSHEEALAKFAQWGFVR